MPVEKSTGSKVTGGTLNGNGSFVFRAERVGRDTLLARIVQLVSEAQRTRPPIQRLADRVAAWFVPAVLLVAVLTFAAWYAFGPQPRLVYATVNAIAVLMIACPCALGLATPMSILVGTGRGAQMGVLIRNAEALETLASVGTLVFDKTGTLTEGRPRVTAFDPDDANLVRIAASLEQSSEHALASAVMTFASQRGLVPSRVERFGYLPGKGVIGMVDGHAAALGNQRLLADINIAAPDADGTAAYLAVDGRRAATLRFEDPLKPSAARAIQELRQEGLDLHLLTGDNRASAESVASRLGIAHVAAEVLPAEKHAYIERLAASQRVAMAGDGVNDAPALAKAHVGIAMGNGTDIAMQTAGITLVKGDLDGILRARRLSRAVLRNIRQNLFFAFFYNLLGVPVAAGVLYPAFGLLLSPMLAAAAMTLSSVSVITNSLRLGKAGLVLIALAVSLQAEDSLLASPAVRKALEYIQANHEAHTAKQIQIAEIPAPTFHEGERAKFMAAEFHRIGLRSIEIDKQGNVLGWRPGQSGKTLVLAAHLDISFAPGVNTKVRKDGPRWHGPGLADDSRGLAALLAIAEALNHGAIRTNRTILFVANVGEEGMGDLNGIRYLLGQSPHKARFDTFISIDGTDPARIINGGTGVKRYRVTFRGPGGHSYGNFGRPSAAHAAARMAARIADFEVPASPKTTFNVGKITAGTTVNAIAEQAVTEVDLRSESPAELDRIELKFFESIRLATEAENAKHAGSVLKVASEYKLVSNRPAGRTPESSPLIAAAMWAARSTGHPNPRLAYASTDSNYPISLGMPAVTLGGGGRSDNAHSLEEWFEPADAWKGPQMVLLTILAFDR
jgi:heavy metal translocating P-type ATPase